MFCDKSVVVFVSKMFMYLVNVNVWLQRVACDIISSALPSQVLAERGVPSFVP